MRMRGNLVVSSSSPAASSPQRHSASLSGLSSPRLPRMMLPSTALSSYQLAATHSAVSLPLLSITHCQPGTESAASLLPLRRRAKGDRQLQREVLTAACAHLSYSSSLIRLLLPLPVAGSLIAHPPRIGQLASCRSGPIDTRATGHHLCFAPAPLSSCGCLENAHASSKLAHPFSQQR